ncbi:MAG TPA: hypothetical protein VHM00_10495 [Caldimonas sp.]|jgi:hypothetical protein|nr:hypothetical protein [Caldimonas sp.]HEX2541498.1 hypothetical protein [Caldimonas sp.]
MGLRDRYMSSMTRRCVVAPPKECNMQQPVGMAEQPAPSFGQALVTLPATIGATLAQRSQQRGVSHLSGRLAARLIWLGYQDHANLAEVLLTRDADSDDRRLCVECAHARPDWRCVAREAFLLAQFQRCPAFLENP